MPQLTQDGPVWTLDLGDDENRFSPDWLASVADNLDAVAGSAEPVVLITTGGGRFYSNGLDLDWLGTHPEEMTPYVARVEALLAKVLTLPVPTVAAVNGHAFGGGAMLAMAHDHRVMRADRGYLCFPEVDIRIPFTPGMAALIQSKLTPRAAIESMTTGRRYGGEEAASCGLVDGVGPLAELPALARGMAGHLAGKDRATLAQIKSTMFADVVAALQPEG